MNFIAGACFIYAALNTQGITSWLFAIAGGLQFASGLARSHRT